MTTKIAFLGLGAMGAPMAARLVQAGYDVTVWNRTTARGVERVTTRRRRRGAFRRARERLPLKHPPDRVGPRGMREQIVIGFIVFGLVVGVLARLIKPGRQHLSILMTLLLGLAGSVIGGVIANLLGTGGIFELNVLGSVVAVIAAVLLIGVFEGAAARRD